jgi:hypothetical protein
LLENGRGGLVGNNAMQVFLRGTGIWDWFRAVGRILLTHSIFHVRNIDWA